MDTCDIVRPSEKDDNTQQLLIASLAQYYRDFNRVKVLSDVIGRNSKISLRILDWFVVSYSREKETRYQINNRVFVAHASYKDQLHSYTKHFFDPFRRKNHVMLVQTHHEPDGNVITTELNTCIGQLVFFRWCFENKIMEYVEKHYDDILHHLHSYIPDPRKSVQDLTEDAMEQADLPKTNVVVKKEKKQRVVTSRKRRVVPTTVKRTIPSSKTGGYVVNFD
jgi:hypothetical protein